MMTRKHNLGRKILSGRLVPVKQRKQVEFQRSVHVQQSVVAMAFLQLLSLHRVAAGNLPEEIIILRGIVGIHQRGGRIGLNGILEHSPVGIVTRYDARRHIEVYSEQIALGGMMHRRTRTILAPARPQVYSVRIAIVGTHPIVASFISAAYRERMFHRESRARHGVKPVDISADVNSRVSPAETDLAKILRAHHVQLLFHYIP